MPTTKLEDRCIPLPELLSQNSSEDRSDADAGKKIAVSSDARGSVPVVAELWMVERQFHEPRKGDLSAGGGDFAANGGD